MVLVLLPLSLVEFSLLGDIVPNLVFACSCEAEALLVFKATESKQVNNLEVSTEYYINH